jgi:hypothetical protein
MKIAIQISGHLRSFRQTCKTFSKAFGRYSPDVFCHTWDTMGHGDAVWWTPTGDSNRDPVNENVQNELTEILKPKKLKVESQLQYVAPEPHLGVKGYSAVRNQYNGIKAANEMRIEYEKETGCLYDVVIRTRYDILYTNALAQKELESASHAGREVGSLSEILFFSNPERMNKICSLVDQIDHYGPKAIAVHGYFEGEIPFRRYITDLGYNVRYSELRCELVRIGGGSLRLF